jgi:hypothetical protein
VKQNALTGLSPRLRKRYGNGARPIGQSSTPRRIATTTANMMAITIAVVCRLKSFNL